MRCTSSRATGSCRRSSTTSSRRVATRRDRAPAPSEIATPGITSIEALTASLAQPADAFLKTLLMRDAAGRVVAVVLAGDRDGKEAKLRKTLGPSEGRGA